MSDLTQGDRVGYNDPSLRSYRGTIVTLVDGPNGGDCVVTWDRSPLAKVEECAFNLRIISNCETCAHEGKSITEDPCEVCGHGRTEWAPKN